MKKGRNDQEESRQTPGVQRPQKEHGTAVRLQHLSLEGQGDIYRQPNPAFSSWVSGPCWPPQPRPPGLQHSLLQLDPHSLPGRPCPRIHTGSRSQAEENPTPCSTFKLPSSGLASPIPAHPHPHPGPQQSQAGLSL